MFHFRMKNKKLINNINIKIPKISCFNCRTPGSEDNFQSLIKGIIRPDRGNIF